MEVSADLRLPRDARGVRTVRAVLRTLLEGLDAPPQTVDEVSLAVSEACGNVVRHASGSARYRIIVRVGPGTCSIDVTDRGPGFTPPEEHGLPLDADEDGRGLALIAALTDGLTFERGDGAMTVHMRKSWS